MKIFLVVAAVLILSGALVQGNKTFNANGVSFDYPDGWTVYDDSNPDAQQLTLARPKNYVQIRVFVHKGHITPEKFAEYERETGDHYEH